MHGKGKPAKIVIINSKEPQLVDKVLSKRYRRKGKEDFPIKGAAPGKLPK